MTAQRCNCESCPYPATEEDPHGGLPVCRGHYYQVMAHLAFSVPVDEAWEATEDTRDIVIPVGRSW